MRRAAVRPILVLALLLAAGACARPVVVESTPTVYTIEVTNPMPHAMTLAYEAGGASRALGRLDPGQTRRFTIPVSVGPRVDLVATSGGGQRVVRRLDLASTEVVRVSLGS